MFLLFSVVLIAFGTPVMCGDVLFSAVGIIVYVYPLTHSVSKRFQQVLQWLFSGLTVVQICYILQVYLISRQMVSCQSTLLIPTYNHSIPG